MLSTRFEPQYDRDEQAPRGRLAPDHSRVLVIGNSQINRIVVSKIVERSGLKPIAESPATAVRVLPLVFPGVIVLDGGADNRDCDSVMEGIAVLRRLTGRSVPSVILLTNRNTARGETRTFGDVDAVVTKPFTPEQLQPAIDRCVARNRAAG